MPQYVKLQQVDDTDLKSVVSKLVALGAAGHFVYAEVGGVRLLSDKVSLDSAYREVTGMSYAEYTNLHAQTDTVSPAKQRISALLNMSATVLSPELKSRWVSKLQGMIKAPGCIDSFEHAIQIISLLNSGNLAEAASLFFNCESSLRGTIYDLVKEFSEYGENFIARIKSESSIRHDVLIAKSTTYF